MNPVMQGQLVGRFRLFIQSADQPFHFFTLVGARAYLPVYRAETGKDTDYYSITDRHTGEVVEAQAGRTE